MLGGKLNTLLAVVEQQNFTKAAKALALTQPAVSHHIRELEEELGVQLIVRRGGRIILTPEGEIAVKYARRMKALYDKLRTELMNTERGRKQLRVGITHTAESNLTAEALAKCSEENPGLSITILTDTIKNLYDMLSSYEIDMAIVEGNPAEEGLRSVMLDTDHLLCVMSVNNPLSRRAMVTRVDAAAEGADSFFPNLDKLPGWTVESVSDPVTENGLTYRFYDYINTNL